MWFFMFFYSEWTKISDEENGWCNRMLCKYHNPLLSGVRWKVNHSHENRKAAIGSAVINSVLYEIYDGKRVAVVRFYMFMVFIFTTYTIVDYFWKIN